MTNFSGGGVGGTTATGSRRLNPSTLEKYFLRWDGSYDRVPSTMFKFLQNLPSLLSAIALVKRVVGYGGSVPKTHSNPHRVEKTRQLYDKPPSQTTRRHLF
jgi:hypothetical protein